MSVHSLARHKWRGGLVAILLGLSSAPAGAQMAPKLPVEAFAQLPQVSNLRLSPDGKYLLMIRAYKGKNHLFIQRATGEGQPVVVPPQDEFEIARASWGNNERVLVSVAFQGWRGATPTYETRLVAISRDGSDLKYIIKKKRSKKTGSHLRGSELTAQIQDDIVDFLLDDPDHFLLSIDADIDGSDELRKIDIHDGNFTELYPEFRGIQNWMTDQQGNVRFGWGVDNRSLLGAGQTRKQIIKYRHADGDFTDFSKTVIYQSGFSVWDFAANPDHAYMRGTADNGRTIFVKYDLRRGEVVETYADERYDAVGMLYDGADSAPIGVRFTGDAEPIIFDPEWAKRYKAINAALPQTSNEIISSDRTRNLHLVLSVSDTDSGVYYVLDERARSLGQVALVNDQLGPAQMAPKRQVTYTARDGLEIPAILTLPLGSSGKDLPTVVLPHGGPHHRDGMSFDYWVQFLANRGYAVLQPNFRGSTGFGRSFLTAGYEQWGLKMQDDVTDGTKWLIEQGIADPKRICIVGGSYGGYAALMGIVREPELYTCAVSVNGVADIPRLMGDAQKYVGGALGTDHINQTGQEEISPEYRVGEIRAPVLLIAAKDDRTVDYRQSKDMAKALKKAKKKYKYVEMESGDHSLTTEVARKTFLAETEAFLAKHIGRGR